VPAKNTSHYDKYNEIQNKKKVFINLSRNNQQMSRQSTLFPVNSLHVSDTFRVHHQEITKINCICNLWYGNRIVRPAVVLAESCWLFLDKLIHDARNIEHKYLLMLQDLFTVVECDHFVSEHREV
jgi:hypothetical protein